MTREEAIAVLEGLSDNPLLSNQHKAAFNIAIHDIKAYHDWNINNLMLINKDNYEPLEQEPKEKCTWIKYDYRTMCPKEHMNIGDSPYWRIPENRMETLKYCPYCGKEIEVEE